MRVKPLTFPVENDSISARLVEPRTGLPGVLFVHGWAGSQERDTERARALSQFGFVSLTFDLRGHGDSTNNIEEMSREDHIADLCEAYDILAEQPQVDSSSIAVVGSSYGGYLASIVSARRAVRWLALRVPALYRDEDWKLPKAQLDKEELRTYRRSLIAPEDNLALLQCSRFAGDVLIVESEHDEIIPHATIASYLSSFIQAHSVTYRVISGADHALSGEGSRRAYDQLLSFWLREMIFGAR